MRRAIPCLVAAAAVAVFGTVLLEAQSGQKRDNLVERLADRLERGEAHLEYSGQWGYLESLLKNLDINVDSQVLVFSRTSLQQDKIGPKTPRAIFFNDTVQVGSVQRGRVFEITVADPQDGIAFYTLDVNKSDNPKFDRDSNLCLACHTNYYTAHAFVASVYPGVDGSPAFLGGDLFKVTDSRTPFEERWGGWYVTGTHGKMKHLGNAVARNPYRPIELETKNTLNQTNLSSKFDTSKYLTPTSDLIALMTLEHQTRAVYYMSALSQQFRAAGDVELAQNKRPDEKKLNSQIENLVSYLTFSDEAKLTDPIKGVSTFTQTFPQRGPRDSKGRSLRDFDLKTKLFKYPLSYMIYTDMFDKMQPRAKERVLRRLYEVLTGPGEDKRAALEIVRETKPNLPDYWRQ
jgi:hypothetical protein